jgi:putative ABC transport system permease protein
VNTLAQDIRYGLRILARSPGFTAAAVLVLALGIGANTAIFSVVNAVLLKPLPFGHPARIVSVPHVPPQDIFPGQKTFAVSPANYLDWKAQNDVFEHMAILTDGTTTLTGAGDPQSVGTGYVSAEFFAVLGLKPRLGRLFAQGDDEPGQRVAVLSEEFWKTRFGSNPSAVGGSIALNGQQYSIVGVLPSGQAYPAGLDVWVPLVFSPEEKAVRGMHDYNVLARLKPGVTLDGARAQMNAIAARLAVQYPKDDKGWGATVIPLHEELVGDVKPALLVLLGAVAFVLLIACANVANLVLARTLGRRKEIAVRAALGATRPRIAQQLFIETTLISLAGGALGVAIAGLGLHGIVAFLGDRMPRTTEIRLDAPVLAFTFGVSLLTGLLAGVIPAVRLTRGDQAEALKQGGRSDSDAGSPAARNALVVAEVALALMLMVGAGLLVRSLGRLRGVDPGFDPKNVLHVPAGIPDEKYTTPEARRAFYARVLERVRALPGVEAAGGMNTLPLSTNGSIQPFAIEGRAAGAMTDQPEVAVRVLTPGTLKTMRIALRGGRDFTAADDERAPAAILVSEAMAKRFWPGENAVGKRLTLTFFPQTVREVVGVVADVKLRGLADLEPVAAIYLPHAQMPGTNMSLLVRTDRNPRGVASAVTAAIRATDPEQPVEGIGTMDEYLRDSLSHQRFNVLLLTAFAALALGLAAVGIYGVLAYAVRRRRREIGIRMALGADVTALLRLVVFQGMRPALVGLGIGLAGSLALGRVLTSLIYGVSPGDPLTLAAVSLLLVLVSLAACALPAWRATRIEPNRVLRES